MEKTCTGCGRTKPLAEYFFRRERQRHYARCKSCFAQKRRRNYVKNRQGELAGHRRWWSNDPERARAVWREMARRKRQNPAYRVHLTISTAIAQAMRGRKSGRSAFSLLGYSRQALVAHLERQFMRGMTWGNFGEWHIDHIVPLASFRLSNDADIRAAWALPNLRPLWAAENIRKKAQRTHLL